MPSIFMTSRERLKRFLEKFARALLLLRHLCRRHGTYSAVAAPGPFGARRSRWIDGAWFGQFHPAEAQQRKLRQTVYVGEIYLDRLYRLPLRHPIAPELSRLPARGSRFFFHLPRHGTLAVDRGCVTKFAIAELRASCRGKFFARRQSLPPGTIPFSSESRSRPWSEPCARKNCRVIHRRSSPPWNRWAGVSARKQSLQ